MKIIVHTEANPEDNAMLQALYSRSPQSVEDHLDKLQNVGSGKFMSQYYVGYGHASIGDCGFVTLYLEGISMLAAKAIEDDPLFNGQECSTRYIDFSIQEFVNPYPAGTKWQEATQTVLDQMRAFYVNSLEPLKAHLKTRFPYDASVKPTVYEKTISAKAFDILRGFLPAGAVTNVAWTTSLRKAHERLQLLMHHPLDEVVKMAAKAYKGLFDKYPSSFQEKYAFESDHLKAKDIRKYLVQEEGEELYGYLADYTHFYSQVHDHTLSTSGVDPVFVYPETVVDEMSVSIVSNGSTKISIPHAHPKNHKIPRHYAGMMPQLDINYLIDFGSFRDIHRHRGGYCSNPLLCPINGYHGWYYENLPIDLQAKAEILIEDIDALYVAMFHGEDDYMEITKGKMAAQYFLPMAVLVEVDMLYSIPQAVYVSELRSGKTVHETLRPIAQKLGQFLKDHGVRCHVDFDEDAWTLRRGTQDILTK